MKKSTKALSLMLVAVLLVTATVFGTMAYLTSEDQVDNTFTVGSVAIKLDEAKANADGTLVEGADRVKANSYHLIPGHTYNKDPMVTVLNGSEESYIKMTMTISNATALDEVFNPDETGVLAILGGYDEANWINKGSEVDTTNNTRTYTFWYKETVAAPNGDVQLDALFDTILVPGELTNEQLAKLQNMTITLNAYAIQADGFENAENAWANY